MPRKRRNPIHTSKYYNFNFNSIFFRYLLFAPSVAHALSYISTAFKDVSEENSLLVYISGDFQEIIPEDCEGGIQLIGDSRKDCLFPMVEFKIVFVFNV